VAAADPLLAAHQLIKAFALDPYCSEIREAFCTLADAQADINGGPSCVDLPVFLANALSFRTLAFAPELVARPELLRAYGECFTGADDATLIIIDVVLSEEPHESRFPAVQFDRSRASALRLVAERAWTTVCR
jgi:hypothetical protein